MDYVLCETRTEFLYHVMWTDFSFQRVNVCHLNMLLKAAKKNVSDRGCKDFNGFSHNVREFRVIDSFRTMSSFKVSLRDAEFCVFGDGMWACNFSHRLRHKFGILREII